MNDVHKLSIKKLTTMYIYAINGYEIANEIHTFKETELSLRHTMEIQDI